MKMTVTLMDMQEILHWSQKQAGNMKLNWNIGCLMMEVSFQAASFIRISTTRLAESMPPEIRIDRNLLPATLGQQKNMAGGREQASGLINLTFRMR